MVLGDGHFRGMHFHVNVFSDNEQQKVYYYSDFENQSETCIQKLLTKQVLILMSLGGKGNGC